MARTEQNPDEQLPQLSVLEVGNTIPQISTPVTNQRVLDLQSFLPRLREYHGQFVKVLAGVDMPEVGRWKRAAERIPFLTVNTRRAHGSGNPRLRDVWMKYDEGE